MSITPSDLQISTLGTCRIDSPLFSVLGDHRTSHHYVDENDRVLFDDTLAKIASRGEKVDLATLPSFEPAGARHKIYFDPAKSRVGIVTCGGLCPGLNDVIRGLVQDLSWHYGVQRISGFRNGYQGFIASYGHSVVDLTPDNVADIGEQGGTILGTSRGQQDPEQIVDCLEQMNINMLFVIGGDGSMAGALKIAQVVRARGDKIAVVGIPKTIDNDVPFIDHSFGFQTAFAEAAHSIRLAHVEARSAPNGVGLVKLMGRHSGFIAAYAALASGDADFVLIPEVPFGLDGESGLLERMRDVVREKGHCVVVVAEGAGQEYLRDEPERRDASGNLKLSDIGRLLRHRITADFAEHGQEVNLRYFDPSYSIRSVPANPYDSVYCIRLAHAAVHAALSGRTEMVVGRWHGRFVHIPMERAVSGRNQVDPNGDLWRAVLEATGQPQRIGTALEEPMSFEAERPPLPAGHGAVITPA